MTSMGIYKRSLLIVLSFITFYHLILVSLFSLYISNNLFPHPHEVNGYLHANKKVMKVAFKAHFKALSRFFQGSFKVRERFIFRYVYLISLIYFIFSISFIFLFYFQPPDILNRWHLVTVLFYAIIVGKYIDIEKKF